MRLCSEAAYLVFSSCLWSRELLVHVTTRQSPSKGCPGAQAERDEEEISEVEMILETYFMHVDNTFNKLQTLCEYIDDTEVRPSFVCCTPA